VGRHHRDLRLTSPPIRTATGGTLDAATLYGILRLRAQVFVVEQACPYLDPDGRDLDPGTRHCWVEHEGAVVAYLRLLAEPGAHRIGRVATAPEARGRGYAAALVRHAVVLAGLPVVLDAQSHLAGWYAALGFERSGPDFVADGIPHTPMRAG
jgi:ElaA protein